MVAVLTRTPAGPMSTAAPHDSSRNHPHLPSRFAALVNPDVLAKRRAAVLKRIDDEAGARASRKRCAEIIANHLLEN